MAPVRIGKFPWQKLMLSSDLPRATKDLLNVLHIYMDLDGSNAHPGVENLILASGRKRTVIIDHLKVAVATGYLVQVERGGYRKKTKRASDYAASVPAEVFERAEKILSSPPWSSAPSGEPDVDEDERPVDRTFVAEASEDERPASRTFVDHEGPVFQSRTSGQSDPTNHESPTIPSSSSPYGAEVEAADGAHARQDDDEEIHEGNNPNPTKHERAVRLLINRADVDLTADQADTVVSHIATTKTIRSSLVGYVASLSAADLHHQLAEAEEHAAGQVRAQQTAADRDAWKAWNAELQAAVTLSPPPVCQHGQLLGDRLRPDGTHQCPQCRDQVTKKPTYVRLIPAPHQRRQDTADPERASLRDLGDLKRRLAEAKIHGPQPGSRTAAS